MGFNNAPGPLGLREVRGQRRRSGPVVPANEEDSGVRFLSPRRQSPVIKIPCRRLTVRQRPKDEGKLALIMSPNFYHKVVRVDRQVCLVNVPTVQLVVEAVHP